MATNPVESIIRAQKRIARNAAVRMLAYVIVPALTALVLAASLPAISRLIWERVGYLLPPAPMDGARLALVLAALVGLVAGAIRGWRAWSESNSFAAAATLIDARLHAREEVVTLANLADPGLAESARTRRTSLFPVLWRHVMAALAAFDPKREFSLDLRRPLKRSSLFTVAMVVALGIAMLAMVRPPTPLERTALRLEQIAHEIEKTSANPEDRAIAAAVRKTAQALLKHKLKPEEERKELETLLKQIEKLTSSRSGSSSSTAKGESGAGSGSSSQQGTGPGEGKGANEAAGGGQGAKQGDRTIELKNELTKAQAQVETQGESKKSGAKPSSTEKTGKALAPEQKPDRSGASIASKEKGPGPIPSPDASAKKGLQPGAKRQNNAGGNQGDTHLGEFPAPADYERFYRAGEKGPPVDIKDARYVLFRIPATTVSAGAGTAMPGGEQPKATTPYTNAPLKPTAGNLPPEEQQLVPPRYRDLIH